MSLSNSAGQPVIHNNVAGLQLKAFDFSIELMRAYRDFVDLVAAMDKALSQNISDQARRLSAVHDVPYEELMAHYGARFSTFASWKSGAADDHSAPE
ncbi:hypothetical protein [Nocardia farcinica]